MLELPGAEPFELRLEGIALHGVAAGDGPLALLAHGITANAYVFLPLMARLAGAMRLVSIDQRGHGRSGKLPSGYAAADFAGDLAALARHFREPALLIGHSLGARNALVCGATTPEVVAGVVAIEFTPYIETAVFDELDARVAGGDREFPDLEAVKSYLRERYKGLPPDAVDRRAAYSYERSAGGYRPLADPAAMRQTATGLREDLAPALTKIRVPTLLVRGAKSRLVSPAAWAKTQALRPDLPAVELAGADHYVPEEVHEALADAIAEFCVSRVVRRAEARVAK